MKFPIRFFPENTRFDFVALRVPAFFITLVMILGSVVLLFTHGINFGTDFKGGILIEARATQGIDVGDLREQLNRLDLGNVELQEFGSKNDVLIRVERQEGGEAEQNAAIAKVRENMGTAYEYRRVEVVGPRVGEELKRNAIIALVLALVCIATYVAVRFEWQFGISALISTFHDVFVTLGLYCLLGMEFDLTAVAALLTLAGYSLNDTVVVFDRIRETMRKHKSATMREIINEAINQTLSRTLMTSLTTLIAILPLVLFGGAALYNFSLAITWGILIGTFSSIYVAASMLLYMKPMRGIAHGLDETTPKTAA